jgi:hypothetical protein
MCGGTWYVLLPSLSLRRPLYTNAFFQMEFAQCHLDWARRNKAAWEEARAEVDNIKHPADEYPRSSVDM